MALFIVLWIVGQSKTVKEAVAAYFKDPTVFSQGSAGLLQGGGAGIRQAPPISPSDAAAQDRAALESTATALREAIHQQSHLAELERKITIELVEEGLRIQLLESTQGVFFDVGSAKVKADTQEVLTMMAREIGRLPNQVALEGHTDSRPYNGPPSYSNWELSTDRANAARRILDASGLRPNQVASVVGYADRRLAQPADPYDAANRRISIIVRFRAERPGRAESRGEAGGGGAAGPAPATGAGEGRVSGPPGRRP